MSHRLDKDGNLPCVYCVKAPACPHRPQIEAQLKGFQKRAEELKNEQKEKNCG